MRNVVLFDGYCFLMLAFIKFLIKRDKEGQFRFATLQSNETLTLLKDDTFKIEENGFVLIQNGKVYRKSKALIKIMSELKKPWNYISIIRVIPPSQLNFFYDIVMKMRYRWFGKREEVFSPLDDVKHKFL